MLGKHTIVEVQGQASVPALKQYLYCAQAQGVDYLPLLEMVGVNSAILQDNNRSISISSMQRLVNLLAQASGDACLGLHAARYVEPASYSVLGYITMSCATLAEVIVKIPIYEKIVGDMGVSSTLNFPDHVLLSWHCQFTDRLARRHEVETVIASWYQYARSFLHVEASFADSIWLEHAPPDDPALLAEYADIFNCEVLFNQQASGILVRRNMLDRPLPQANEKLLQTLLDHAAQIVLEMDCNKTVTEQVKDMLRLMLKDSTPSSILIADKLGMSGRTLQRKLQDEGAHYKDILNELRLELALYYLKNTSLSLENIAGKLGYTEPRSFYRSFKQWTGRTAGSYRTSVTSPPQY